MLELNKLYNLDCMEGMAQFPDKYFDLAIVDPPYGIGDKFKGGRSGKMNFNEIPKKGWDTKPDNKYFNELQRIAKNQIVWGGNYFNLPPSRCFIVWDKLISEDFSLAMVELAWTSFDKLAKIVRIPTPKNGKIHPTQKPTKLYKWLLHNYANADFKIIDTHAGSCSSVIAFLDFGCDWIAFEIDKDYYEAANKRIENHKLQLKLF